MDLPKTPEFIVVIFQHSKFGWIASTYYAIDLKRIPFFEINDRLNREHEEYEKLSQDKKQIVSWCDDFSDEVVVNRFGKRKQNFREFYQQLDPDRLQKFIIPFIEKRLRGILELVVQGNIPLYKSDGRPKNIFPEDRINYFPYPAQTIFNFIKKEEELLYYLSLRNKEEEIILTQKSGKVLVNQPCYVLIENQMYWFKDIDGKKLLPFFLKNHIEIPNQVREKYLSSFVLNSIKQYEVKSYGFSIHSIRPIPRGILKLEYDLNYLPAFSLTFDYEGYFICRIDSSYRFKVNFHWTDGDYYFDKINRDFQKELEIQELLVKLGLISTGSFYWLAGTKQTVYQAIQFIRANTAELELNGIFIKQHLTNKIINLEEVRIELRIDQKIDWFDIDGTIRFGEFEFSFKKLRNYILTGNNEFLLPDGSIGIIPDDWFVHYEDLFQYSKDESNTLRLDRHHYHVLSTASAEQSEHILKNLPLLNRLNEKPEVDLPQSLQANLRTYQTEGYSWLHYLYQNRLGGCLADDMGLGKTLQAIALLCKIYEGKNMHRPKLKHDDTQLSLFTSQVSETIPDEDLLPSLIVLPTSLIHNWANELKRFSPGLRFLVYHGIDRTKRKQTRNQFYRNHLVLTSYGTIRNEIEHLNTFPFHYIILDEAQNIKNPDSKIFASVRQLKSNHRLIITGTPIENSLQDLWAQFTFINPGFLGNNSFFKNKYLVPIEKGGNEKQTEKLKSLIQPFILRRTKSEVAKDLPPLTIQTRYCTMDEAQAKLYSEYKQVFRNSILSLQEKNELHQSGMLILKGILHLRQLANHPLLVEADYSESSGKLDAVIELLESLREEHHKVLVFSSFVKHLEILEQNFIDRSWRYSKLTGSTKKREKVINEFQQDAERNFFLLSIKAGGVGLNLTEADYIVILDPWWNPAVEMQAINRAHRIGQVKSVFVYRFITEGSIEEKIHQLQEKKSRLIQTFINENDPFAGIDLMELVGLLD